VYRLWRVDREQKGPFRAELIACALYAVVALLAFALRPITFEMRYFLLLTILLGVLAMFATVEAGALALGRPLSWRDPSGEGEPTHQPLPVTGLSRSVAAGFAVLGAVLCLGWVPVQDVVLGAHQRQPTTHSEGTELRADYLREAREVASRFGGAGPIVVGDHPYFFTLATHLPALSIPESDDTYLLGYMDRYHARYLFLTEEELAFWRPAWLRPGGLPSALVEVDRLGTTRVFEKREAP
jgi:hypothetical protein